MLVSLCEGQEHGEMLQVKIKFRLNFFNKVDFQFPLSPSPRQRQLSTVVKKCCHRDTSKVMRNKQKRVF